MIIGVAGGALAADATAAAGPSGWPTASRSPASRCRTSGSGCWRSSTWRWRSGSFPASGYVPVTENPLRALYYLTLPAVILGTGLAAVVMRQTRSSMLETLSTDYVRTARAKGLPRGRVLRDYALRNSLIVVVTIIGLQLGGLISGAVVTERIFGLPGFGKLTLDSVFSRDYPVIQAVVVVVTAAYIADQPGGRRALLRDQPADPRRRGVLMAIQVVPADADRAASVRRRRARDGRRRALRSLLRNPLGLVGGGLLLVVVLVAVLAPRPRAVPADRRCTSTPRSSGSARSASGWAATTWAATRCPASSTAPAPRSRSGCCRWRWPSSSGCRSAWSSGWWRTLDAFVSRLTDLLLAFPFLILAVGLAAIRGPSLTNAALALGIAQVPTMIRVVRAETLRWRSADFVASARAHGRQQRAGSCAATSCRTAPPRSSSRPR